MHGGLQTQQNWQNQQNQQSWPAELVELSKKCQNPHKVLGPTRPTRTTRTKLEFKIFTQVQVQTRPKPLMNFFFEEQKRKNSRSKVS